MIIIHNHMDFISRNIYVADRDYIYNLSDVDVNLEMLTEHIVQNFVFNNEEIEKQVNDFYSACRPTRNGIKPCVYCFSMYNTRNDYTYHIVYTLVGTEWKFCAIPYEKLWKIIPSRLYDGTNIESYRERMSSLFQLSYTVGSDLYEKYNNHLSLRIDAEYITIYYSDEYDIKTTVVVYSKKDKLLSTPTTKILIDKAYATAINGVLMSLFSNDRYIFIDMDGTGYELVKI